MANFLKVGIVKQETTQMEDSNASVVTLRIDENINWDCSQLIDNQMYSTLFEYGILGKEQYAVTEPYAGFLRYLLRTNQIVQSAIHLINQHQNELELFGQFELD